MLSRSIASFAAASPITGSVQMAGAVSVPLGAAGKPLRVQSRRWVQSFKLNEQEWNGPIAESIAARSVGDWLDETRVPDVRATATTMRNFYVADPKDLSLLVYVEQFAGGGNPAGTLFTGSTVATIIYRSVWRALCALQFACATSSGASRRREQGSGSLSITAEGGWKYPRRALRHRACAARGGNRIRA